MLHFNPKHCGRSFAEKKRFSMTADWRHRQVQRVWSRSIDRL